jgi:predicted dehydrogenase
MRYVIVGSGVFSNTWVSVLAAVPGCELVGCVSRSGKRPAKAALDLECRPTLTEIAAPFDAVILTTPNGLHHVGAIEAAQLGKHVLTEKPLDITAAAMDAVISACEQAGVTLAVAYQQRMSPDNIALHGLLSSGALGRIYAVDLACKVWRDQAYYDSGVYRGGFALDGGGPFIQQACHKIDLYQWFFGMPSEVRSLLGTLAHDIEGEDHGVAILRHDNGMIGSIVASTVAYPGFPARFEVHGERGSFTVVDDNIIDWHIRDMPNPAWKLQHDGAPWTDTSRQQAILRDFEAAVCERRAPFVDAHSARRTTELVLRIYGRDEHMLGL